MSFVLGMVVGALFMFSIISETICAFRPVFSCLFFVGVVGLIAFIYFIGLLLSPWFLVGLLTTIVLFGPLFKGDDK